MFGANRPLSCGFYITNACNLKCSFCNIRRKSEIRTLPYEKAKQLVDDLSRLGTYYFSITGGEPLTVEYVFRLLSYARKSYIKHLHLVTNGYILDCECAKKLNDTGVDEISISIDGPEQRHDNARGVPGSYSNARKAIEALKKEAPKISIVLNTIFYPQNPDACLHVVDIAKSYNIFMKLQPLNQHPVFNRDCEINQSQEDMSGYDRETVKKVIDALSINENIINSHAFLNNLYRFYFDRDNLALKKDSCIFGSHHIEVLENGKIFPCLEGMCWENGIDYDRPLAELIITEKYSDLLKGLKSCQKCLKNYYICYYEPRLTFPVMHFLRYCRDY